MGSNNYMINKIHMISCITSIVYFLGSTLYEFGLLFNLNTKSFWDIYTTVTAILSVPYYITSIFYIPYALITIVYIMAVVQFIAQLREGSKTPKYIIISLIAIIFCTFGMKSADSMLNGMKSLGLLQL